MLTGTLLLITFGLGTIETADAGDRFPRLKKLFNRNRDESDKEELSDTDQLIKILRTQPSVTDRLDALEELGEVDPRKNADVVPALYRQLATRPIATSACPRR